MTKIAHVQVKWIKGPDGVDQLCAWTKKARIIAVLATIRKTKNGWLVHDSTTSIPIGSRIDHRDSAIATAEMYWGVTRGACQPFNFDEYNIQINKLAGSFILHARPVLFVSGACDDNDEAKNGYFCLYCAGNAVGHSAAELTYLFWPGRTETEARLEAARSAYSDGWRVRNGAAFCDRCLKEMGLRKEL